MSTLMLLYIRHEGVDDLPVDVVATDYFGLSTTEFLKRASRFGLRPIRVENNTDDLRISLIELAKYIETRRLTAAEEMQKFRSEAASGSAI